MEKVRDELIEFLARFGSWIIGISVGVAAKLAFESKARLLSKKEKIVIVVISAFIGYLTALYWDYRHWDNTIKIAVPVATLVGEGAVEFMMDNLRTILKAVFKNNFGITTKDKK